MKTGKQSGTRGLYAGTVLSNNQIRSCFWKIILAMDSPGSQAFATTNPGQFAEFDLSTVSIPPSDTIPEHLRDASARQILLRRPFSFSDVSISYLSEGVCTKIEVIYCVLGPATVRMTTLKKNDQVSILGPLGNGFWYPKDMKNALLVSGGIGAPPILHLAGFLKQHYPDICVTAFAGAKNVDKIPFHVRIGNKTGIVIEDFERLAIPAFLSTDDGSGGRKGFVTESLRQWIRANRPLSGQTVLYACGPEAMLAECAKIAEEEGILCQVSMERMMACGIGLCQSCAVQIAPIEAEQPRYKLCCKEGPVFDSRTVAFTNGRR